MQDSNNTFYMQRALALAELGRYTVSPNPMVGCVLVKNNAIIGEGYHQRAGEPHAEVYALKNAGINANGATAYISLEPCCHTGRTPPCTNALIDAGLKKAYVACLDPNPLVAGKGIEVLKKAGIEVIVGLCQQEAKELNKIFFHFIKNRRPYVINKWAMSLDGKTVTNPEDDRIISCQTSLQHSHQTRQTVDAILIGARTAILDNPLLTVRHIKTIKHPLRFILASQGNLPLDLKCFDPGLPGKTIVVTTPNVDSDWLTCASEKGIEVWQCAAKNQKVDLHDLLDKLGQANITSLLVEGGETIRAGFFAENLVNEIQVYLAPKIISQLTRKQTLSSLQFNRLGDDVFLQATVGDSCKTSFDNKGE